jgi:hypothetical protein
VTVRLVRTPPAPPAFALAAFGTLSAAVLLVARVVAPDRLFHLTCPLKRLAGLPCPSCGMTRAFCRLMRGELGDALHVSPLGAALAVAALACAAWLVLRLTVARRGVALELSARESRAARAGVVAVVVGNWVWLVVSGSTG